VRGRAETVGGVGRAGHRPMPGRGRGARGGHTRRRTVTGCDWHLAGGRRGGHRRMPGRGSWGSRLRCGSRRSRSRRKPRHPGRGRNSRHPRRGRCSRCPQRGCRCRYPRRRLLGRRLRSEARGPCLWRSVTGRERFCSAAYIHHPGAGHPVMPGLAAPGAVECAGGDQQELTDQRQGMRSAQQRRPDHAATQPRGVVRLDLGGADTEQQFAEGAPGAGFPHGQAHRQFGGDHCGQQHTARG